MSTRHLAVLRLPIDVDRRRIDAVTARAIRHGLLAGAGGTAATEGLRLLANDDHAVLSAAIDRIERAFAVERSRAAIRASTLLRQARTQVERLERPAC